MSERSCRPRRVTEPPKTQKELAMAAAKEYLKEGNISFRAAAEKHGVNYPSHISYWVKQWRGTLMEQVFANEESAEEPVPENNHNGEGGGGGRGAR
ncbi:hypothetical protein AB1Y20_018218 [Prymnesium parvum]|uniref:HTH psq-type domain-containing protein n=1 Tax=Prymnesium parvum TaxID=97485 RepID=A0AB34JR72_PRYPA